MRWQNRPIARPHPCWGGKNRPPVPIRRVNVRRGFLKSIFPCCCRQPDPECWGDAGYETGAQCSRAVPRFAGQQGARGHPWGRVSHPHTDPGAGVRAGAPAGRSGAARGSGCPAIPLGKSNVKREKVNVVKPLTFLRARLPPCEGHPAVGKPRPKLWLPQGCHVCKYPSAVGAEMGGFPLPTPPRRAGGSRQLPATGAGVRQGTPISLLVRV